MATEHPLSRPLTRVREAQGALGALLLALDDDRTSDADRAALRRLLARIEQACATAGLRGRYLARNLERLATALRRDEPPEDVLRA